jgi:GntR family transcriptional regulator
MFKLDLKNKKSIYEQVVDGMKEMIVSGSLKSGEKIPSVRDLSAELTVNPNTVQKAYRQLEEQGWIYTVTGRGAFVSEDIREADSGLIKEIFAHIEPLVRQLRFLNVSGEEIVAAVAEMTKEGRI